MLFSLYHLVVSRGGDQTKAHPGRGAEVVANHRRRFDSPRWETSKVTSDLRPVGSGDFLLSRLNRLTLSVTFGRMPWQHGHLSSY